MKEELECPKTGREAEKVKSPEQQGRAEEAIKGLFCGTQVVNAVNDWAVYGGLQRDRKRLCSGIPLNPRDMNKSLAGCWTGSGLCQQKLPRAGEEHKHRWLQGHPALMGRRRCPRGQRLLGHRESLALLSYSMVGLQELGVHRNMLSYLLDLYIEFGGWAFWGFVF